jgi:hypothetical protein
LPLLKLRDMLLHTFSFGLEVFEILLKLRHNFLSGGEVPGWISVSTTASMMRPLFHRGMVARMLAATIPVVTTKPIGTLMTHFASSLHYSLDMHSVRLAPLCLMRPTSCFDSA